MSCDCEESPLGVDPLIGGEAWRKSRSVGVTGPTGPAGVVADMRTATGPFSAIVEQDLCSPCGLPILSAAMDIGNTDNGYRGGTVQLWTAADDGLTKGAWFRLEVDRTIVHPVSTGQGGLEIETIALPAQTQPGPTGIIGVPMLVKPFAYRDSFFIPRTLYSRGAPLKISAGYGDVTTDEWWGVDSSEAISVPNFDSLSMTVALEVGTAARPEGETIRVGADLSVANYRGPSFTSSPDVWRRGTFCVEVPASSVWPTGPRTHEPLRNAVQFEYARTTGPFGQLTSIARPTLTLHPNGNDGKTNVRALNGFATGPTGPCSVADGPFWHEQAIVRPGTPLAVEGALHKLTLQLTGTVGPPAEYDASGDWPFGNEFGLLGFRRGFRDLEENPSSHIQKLRGMTVECLPIFDGRRLLPGNYKAQQIATPVQTYSKLLTLYTAPTELSDADYDIQYFLDVWVHTANPDPNSIFTAVTITVHAWKKWVLRRVYGGAAGDWFGNATYIKGESTGTTTWFASAQQCLALSNGEAVDLGGLILQISTL